MFSKIDVNGSDACELYQWLKAAKADEEGGSDIPWNFAKFLIDKSGQVVARFSPQTSPEELDDAIFLFLCQLFLRRSSFNTMHYLRLCFFA